MTTGGVPGLVLVGGGGHCLSCIEVIESTRRFAIAGIVDSAMPIGGMLHGFPVLGTDDDLPAILRSHGAGLVTVGQIESAAVRRRLFDALRAAGANAPWIAAATATISRRAVVGDGSVIFHKATVNAGATVGLNCIVNTGSIIEHGATLGDHVHVATGAIVNGDCAIGDGSFVGSGAVVLQRVRVGAGVVIGAGSVVRHDVEIAGVYAGNPLRLVRAAGGGGR